MAPIPLPALDVRPPQPQENPMDMFARVTQLKSIQQGQQLQQQQLQAGQLDLQQKGLAAADDANWRAAFHDWDGKDTDGLLALGQKYGVGPKSFSTMASALLQMKQTGATLQKDQLDNLQKVNDMARGQITSVLNAPADKQQDAWTQMKQNAINNPQLPAPLRDAADRLPDIYPGNEEATIMANHFALGSTLAKEETERTTAQAHQQQADTGQQRLEAELPGIQAENTTKQAQAGVAPQIAQLDVQGKQAGIAETQARTSLTQTQQQILTNQPAAVQSVPVHLVGKALDDYQKAGEQYADAQNASQDMKTFIDMARSGNKIAYAYSPVEGVLQFNTARGIKRVNMPEIHSYGGAGDAADRVMGFFGKQTSGASIPDDVLNDMESLHGAIATNAQTLYGNKLKVINQAYGSKFQPVDLGGPPSSAGAAQAGYTRIQASDGSTHDIPTANLDKAKQRDPNLKVMP
jgi:hypothetical protein